MYSDSHFSYISDLLSASRLQRYSILRKKKNVEIMLMQTV